MPKDIMYCSCNDYCRNLCCSHTLTIEDSKKWFVFTDKSKLIMLAPAEQKRSSGRPRNIPTQRAGYGSIFLTQQTSMENEEDEEVYIDYEGEDDLLIPEKERTTFDGVIDENHEFSDSSSSCEYFTEQLLTGKRQRSQTKIGAEYFSQLRGIQ